ncbi:hypothetical protein JMK10_08915 [Rhodovulum sulfidophilum]|uniref:hypothetical protein n=1 Tax=Rhodovulum sulfidophilum TaxID=35806 RepID=UPI001F450390|nr:hypothetical protein [Rhodovulum sulfidophilum]MCE8433319.1 hypothetical protein [Rhodovulum sulfidophilum]MCF4116926.1 hypothetical protein [Rhodovulum sulfidophilum]
MSEGEIEEMHIGLKGPMNALFLKDLAKKTRGEGLTIELHGALAGLLRLATGAEALTQARMAGTRKGIVWKPLIVLEN